MLKLVLDSSALITSCQATVRRQPAIEHVLAVCEVVIPQAVQLEVVVMGRHYADAAVANRLISAGRIKVETVVLPPGNVLDGYRLGSGEKEAMALYLRQAADFDCLVTDDRLAYIVGNRCEIPMFLFLDLLIELVSADLMTPDLAKEIAQATQHRYSVGFVPHTLRMLERGDRRCLV